MHALSRAHDAITRASFGVAGAMLGVIALSFCYEVISRYFFGAPTEWASPLVSYAMAAMIFLAFPEMSRNAAHISMNVVAEAVPPHVAKGMMRLCRVVAALSCLMATWFTFRETLNQFNTEIWTNPPFAVPKWLISMFIPYGMFSSALYFLRQSWDPVAATAPSLGGAA